MSSDAATLGHGWSGGDDTTNSDNFVPIDIDADLAGSLSLYLIARLEKDILIDGRSVQIGAEPHLGPTASYRSPPGGLFGLLILNRPAEQGGPTITSSRNTSQGFWDELNALARRMSDPNQVQWQHGMPTRARIEGLQVMFMWSQWDNEDYDPSQGTLRIAALSPDPIANQVGVERF
jgi:hypothetical protein